MGSTLISLRQYIWQTVPALIGYGLFRDGFGKNLTVMIPFMRHAAGTAGKAMKIPIPEQKKHSIQIEDFIKRHAFSLYLRFAEGIDQFRDDIKSGEPRIKNRMNSMFHESSALHGFEKKYLNRIGGVSKAIKNGILSTTNAAMGATIAAAEKVGIQSVFMNEIVKQVTKKAETDGNPNEVTLEGVLEGKWDDYLSFDLKDNARIIAVDIFGQSDTSKKAPIFQRSDNIPADVTRGMFVTFANHLMSTAANSYAGYRMYKEGRTDEDRAEGRRLISTSLAQNAIYQGMNFGLISYGVSKVLGPLFGLDDKEREEAIKWVYGLDDEEGEEDLGSMARGLLTKYVMGSSRPFGYDAKTGRVTDDRYKKDMAAVQIRIIGEGVNQIPGLGMMTSTLVGGGISQNVIGDAHTGITGTPKFGGEKAGISLGDDAQNGNVAQRAVYTTSKLFNEWLAPRSYFFMGSKFLMEPVYHASNATKDVPASTYGNMIAPMLPFLPRESRSSNWEKFDEPAGVKIWHNPYSKKGKGKKKGRSVRKSR